MFRWIQPNFLQALTTRSLCRQQHNDLEKEDIKSIDFFNNFQGFKSSRLITELLQKEIYSFFLDDENRFFSPALFVKPSLFLGYPWESRISSWLHCVPLGLTRSCCCPDRIAHWHRTALVRAALAVVVGVPGDNVDELVAELTRRSSLDLAAGEEVSQNQAHLLAGIVVADGPGK